MFGTKPSGLVRASFGLACAIALALPACLDSPVCDDCAPDTKNWFVERVPIGGIDKIDLLFMIDDSVSMADKQRLLIQAVPSLLSRFVTPLCLDAEGAPNGERWQAGACPSGVPEFPPLSDIHIGVISSSLGDGGGEFCTNVDDPDDDKAWLLPLARPELGLSSYDGKGFLAWDPEGTRNTPPGTQDAETLSQGFENMVAAVGEHGCGHEASLEAWYRFLIAPDPPERLELQGYTSVAVGLDQQLLAQRAAFLRPDSLVTIVMLTDENDCSVRAGTSAGVLALKQRMPRGTSACAANPDDLCCRSCAAVESAPPAGCLATADDPECQKGVYTELEDSSFLRCFEQKRRFGADTLEPIERYVRGLTSASVTDRNGAEQPNPLFVGRPGAAPRDRNLVYLAGIVGVPWQDVASTESLTGSGLRYLSAQELASEGRWQLMLGDPASGRPPGDPHMIETVAPRAGNHPLVAGGAIAPPDAPTPTTDAISGHEQTPAKQNDLQYACTYELEMPKDCSTVAEGEGCDCNEDEVAAGRPLCQPPAGGPAGTMQYYAKAYPAVRQLRVLQGIGEQAVVASICPKVVRASTEDPAADPNYGYNPAVAAIVDRLGAELGDRCLGRSPSVDDAGRTTCLVVEADLGGQCDCNAAGRSPARTDVIRSVREDLQSGKFCDAPGLPACDSVCGCELAQASGDALAQCRSATDAGVQAPGYCYVDPDRGLGDASLVRNCPSQQRRLLRFVGPATPAPGKMAFMTCVGGAFEPIER